MADATPSAAPDAIVTPIPTLNLDPAVTPEAEAPAPKEDESRPDEQTPETEAAAEGEEPKRDPKTGRFEKRKEQIQQSIDTLVAQKHQAQREVADLVAKAQRLRQQLESKPNIDPNDYEAVESHRMRQAIRAEQHENISTELERADQRTSELRAATFMAKVEAAQERIPDIQDVLGSQAFRSLPIAPAAADIIAESGKAAEIAYHLAKNPQTAFRLATMTPAQQGAEIARIEARLEVAPQARKTTKAPAPVPTLGGSRSAAVKDTSDMSVEELQTYLTKAMGRR